MIVQGLCNEWRIITLNGDAVDVDDDVSEGDWIERHDFLDENIAHRLLRAARQPDPSIPKLIILGLFFFTKQQKKTRFFGQNLVF